MPGAASLAGGSSRRRFGAPPVVGSRLPPEFFKLEINAPGTFHRREGMVKLLQRYDVAGGTNINQAAATAFPWDTEERRDTDFYGAIGGNPTRLVVSKGGTYRFNYAINALTGAATQANVRAYARKNGAGGEITGSHGQCIGINTSGVPLHLTSTFVIDLVANDYLEIMTIRVLNAGAANSVANHSHALVELLGYDGESALGGKASAFEAGSLVMARLTKGQQGTGGNTTVDVLKNGVSILPTTKLSISGLLNLADFYPASFSDVTCGFGDLFEIDVTGTETPAPARDLKLELIFKRA